MMRLLSLAVMPLVASPAQVEVIQPPTSCVMGPHYSVHVNPRRFCRAGKEFVAVFQSHFVALPQQPAWLMVSTRSNEPVPLSSVGFPGCWLMVDPDPRHFYLLAPDKQGPVTQQNGRLVLRWTPTDTMRGATLYSQMLWFDLEANAGHHLVGPLLKVTVE